MTLQTGFNTPGGWRNEQGAVVLTSGSESQVRTERGVGGVPSASAAAGVSAEDHGIPGWHRTVFTLSDVNITITRGSNVGRGSLQLYDFPQGGIVIDGARSELSLARVGTNISATWAGNIHIGTTAQTDVAAANIVATQHNIAPTTAIAAATAGVAAGKSVRGNVVAPLDGTVTASDAYLNIMVTLADISTGNDALIATGTLVLYWRNLDE